MEASSADDASWREGWDIDRTVAYLQNNGFTRVTLQFPDDLLEQSTIVCAAIQQQCAVKGILAQVTLCAHILTGPRHVLEPADLVCRSPSSQIPHTTP